MAFSRAIGWWWQPKLFYPLRLRSYFLIGFFHSKVGTNRTITVLTQCFFQCWYQLSVSIFGIDIFLQFQYCFNVKIQFLNPSNTTKHDRKMSIPKIIILIKTLTGTFLSYMCLLPFLLCGCFLIHKYYFQANRMNSLLLHSQ